MVAMMGAAIARRVDRRQVHEIFAWECILFIREDVLDTPRSARKGAYGEMLTPGGQRLDDRAIDLMAPRGRPDSAAIF